MNRKISVGMMVTIVILACTVTFSVTMLAAMRLFDRTVSSVKEKESMYNKIAEVDRYVRSNDYYTIDETLLYDRLTAGYLLGTGDQYAKYYTAAGYTELLNVQNGTLVGIGVELGKDQTGYARVTRVYEDSPAQEAGITVGDYLTAVDGADVKTMATAEIVQARLRGEVGTTVHVVWLDSEAAEHAADLTHSGYTATTMDYQLLESGVGYLKIRQFGAKTPSELDYAVRALSRAGAASLLFDLRDNGGGLLDAALSCLDLLCPEGTLAYAEDKNGTRTVLGSSDAESAVSLPMVCLVNGKTASAAELFATTLRTLNGARLVGVTTQGKGTIQSSPQRLTDGSAVVITVAKLISGDGSCFDGTGLTVDVERPLSVEEETAFYAYTVADDPQIQRAVLTAQQMTGTATLSAVNGSGAASSPAASEPEAESQTASDSEEESDSEAASGSEADAGSEDASSAEAASGSAGSAAQ